MERYIIHCPFIGGLSLRDSTVVVLSVLELLSQYSELDGEENKFEVRLFDKQ